MTLHVELVSPERVLYSGEADMVVCRTVGGGDVAFLTGHAPFLGALETYPVRILTADREEAAAVHGGFVEVSHDQVTILSDTAELAGHIDVERARRARDEAQRGLQESPDDPDLEAALRRAEVRMDLAGAAGAAPAQAGH